MLQIFRIRAANGVLQVCLPKRGPRTALR